MSSHPQASAPSWSRQEFTDLDLGDTRLNDRLVHIADALAAEPMSPLRTACGDWSVVKAAYRFFDNDKVSPEKRIFNRRLNVCGVMSVSLRSKIPPILIIPIIRQRRA